MFKEEINKINTTDNFFYHRGMNEMIPVQVLHSLSIVYSPERRGKNYITLGNGEYAGRWGYKCKVSYTSKQLSHCDEC